MVKIRLRRMGAKKRPFYRVVVADSKKGRNGSFTEIIGTYDPMVNPAAIKLKNDRAVYWLGVGAQPSDTAKYLLEETATCASRSRTRCPTRAGTRTRAGARGRARSRAGR
jgi:small subunit ribosomal protein S16